jgi:hypothetical protein
MFQVFVKKMSLFFSGSKSSFVNSAPGLYLSIGVLSQILSKNKGENGGQNCQALMTLKTFRHLTFLE